MLSGGCQRQVLLASCSEPPTPAANRLRMETTLEEAAIGKLSLAKQDSGGPHVGHLHTTLFDLHQPVGRTRSIPTSKDLGEILFANCFPPNPSPATERVGSSLPKKHFTRKVHNACAGSCRRRHEYEETREFRKSREKNFN